MNSEKKICLHSYIITKINHGGDGEQKSIVWNDDVWKPKFSHDYVPIEMLHPFCSDLGYDFDFYPFCEVVHPNDKEL